MNPMRQILAAGDRKIAARVKANLAKRARTKHQLDVVSLSFREFSRRILHLEPSPLIGAIMDASDGLPLDLDNDLITKHFGGAPPKSPPRTVCGRCGGRGGKSSRLAAPKVIHAALTVPLKTLAAGESAYALIIAPMLKLARQTLSFVKGYIHDSDLVNYINSEDNDHIALRRPHDDHVVRIEVGAAGRGGTQLRGKTLVCAVMDEACFFRDESTGVVNDTEIYRAVLQRIVPGGQCWVLSTPWVLGMGLLEDLIARNFGSHENALCVVAATRDINPTWDPTGEISADLIANDPDAYEREVLAIPLTAGTLHFFSAEAIKAAVDKSMPHRLTKIRECTYSAGGDTAFKRNSSALAIVERLKERYRVACIEELKPTQTAPLSPAIVAQSFAKVMESFGCVSLVVDSHERQAVAEELVKCKMGAMDAPNKVDSYLIARKMLHEGRLVLPDNPRLLMQLRNVMAKPTPGGGMTITSPRSADGSHGDLVSALVNACWLAERNGPVKLASSVGTSRGSVW